ncbi:MULTISPECIES: HEAT repeat domain-containing protein [unclassified Streptomyces]|uniref:HEAT repeat domain-containing protein n=1 Tax=unclassified Streptomyces TaxID=2593676 RepID=UPI003D922019
MFEPVIAPSGTLLGLLQRGRGDGTLHALTAPRAEALAALNHCVLRDPRHDWQVENRSLYYARLFLDLNGELDEIEAHLFGAEDVLDTDECRTGLALAVLGHLASYGRLDALHLLRRYAASGTNWAWALDELALRDDDAGLRSLAAPVLARFPADAEGEAELAAAVRDAFEPRPWRLWAEDPRESIATRVRAAQEAGCFDRWQRQLQAGGPRPGWSVQAVFDWAQQGIERGAVLHVPAARCLTAVAGPEDRPEIVEAARSGGDGARCTALRYLADGNDPDALDLIEGAVSTGSALVVDAALDAFERMRSVAAVDRARGWAHRPDALGGAAGRMLACRGGAQDSDLVLAALREAVRGEGPDAATLWTLVDGAGRLEIACAAPVLRHIYRETASSHLRGRAARALAATDPSFPAGFAVECLWDCEESTREIAARHAETGDTRVVERLRRLAADPAEEAEVQTAVRSRIGPDMPTV